MMPFVILAAELALRGQLACAVAGHFDAFPRPVLVVETWSPGYGCLESWRWSRSLGERVCRRER